MKAIITPARKKVAGTLHVPPPRHVECAGYHALLPCRANKLHRPRGRAGSLVAPRKVRLYALKVFLLSGPISERFARRTDAGAEALYWLGVAQYKQSHDPAQLRPSWQRLAREYPTSEWAQRTRIPGKG